MRTAGRVQQARFVALAFALLLLACMDVMASDIERQIPVIQDTAGSNVTVEVSREGTRQTATPSLTLNNMTAQRIEERIEKNINRVAAKEIPSEATIKASLSAVGLTGTARGDAGRTESESALSSVPPLPKEITARSVQSFLKGLRSSRKEKPVPAVAAASPEQRLGMAETSSRKSN